MTRIVLQALVVILTFIGVTSGQGFQWNSTDGKYFVSIGDLGTWETAFGNCTSMDRTLVTIQDETEQFEVLAAGRVSRTIHCGHILTDHSVYTNIKYGISNTLKWNRIIRRSCCIRAFPRPKTSGQFSHWYSKKRL